MAITIDGPPTVSSSFPSRRSWNRAPLPLPAAADSCATADDCPDPLPCAFATQFPCPAARTAGKRSTVMIILCSRLALQPCSMKSTASQSSSSRIHRRRSHLSEVIRRGDDALAEMVLPHAVDDHSRRQRIVAAGQPLRESQPIARRFSPANRRAQTASVLPGRAEHLGESGRHLGTGRFDAAALQQTDRGRLARHPTAPAVYPASAGSPPTS